jgi:hypothetical protein
MDIYYVDTPSGEAVEKSRSYNLSIFSFGGNSEGAEVIAPHENSSPSIGELWPDIDKLDDPPHEDTTIVHAHNTSIHGKRSAAPIENTNKCSRRERNMDSSTDIAGTFDFRSKRHGGGSTRKEASRILSAAPGAIFPHMRMSFIDR